MHEQPQIQLPGQQPPDRQRFNFALLVSAAAVVIVLAGLYLWPGRQTPSRGSFSGAHLPFGPAERDYAAKIQLENLALSRAENFLHQEVTTLSGELLNAGDRRLLDVELTIEFSDELNQVVLREVRSAVASASPPLAPGERRNFEVSFEHIPASWNMRPPTVRVTGLQFAPAK